MAGDGTGGAGMAGEGTGGAGMAGDGTGGAGMAGDGTGGAGMAGGDEIHTVVVNHEEQYSIWPARRPLPAGWTEVGKRGTKAECLAYIGEVWTDMRPKSVRDRLDAPKPGNE